MNLKCKLFSVQGVLVLLITSAVGCVTNLPDTTPTEEIMLSPETRPSPTPIGLIRFLPTPSPFPTMVATQQELLIQGLHSPSCKLPCYLGIIPGETRWPNAQEILESMGAVDGGTWSNSDSGYVLHALVFRMCCEAANRIHPITLTVDGDDIVQRVNANIYWGYGYTKPDYWSYYSLRNIFVNTGLPDEIVMVLENYGSKTQFVLGVVYETLGILVVLSGPSDGRKICLDAGNIELLESVL